MNRLASIWAVILVVAAMGYRGKPQTAAQTSATGAPPPVEQAEALAEDIQTDLAQNDWPAAETGLRELRSLGDKLDSAGVPQPKRSAYGRAVDSLGKAITRRSQSDALTAANQVSRTVTGIMADYPTRMPVQVVYMDVAGRDVLYAAQQGHWGSAAAPLAELGRSYAAVQGHVRADNFALDERITWEIAQLHRAIASRTRDRATSLVQALLDDVDRIELMF